MATKFFCQLNHMTSHVNQLTVKNTDNSGFSGLQKKMSVKSTDNSIFLVFSMSEKGHQLTIFIFSFLACELLRLL